MKHLMTVFKHENFIAFWRIYSTSLVEFYGLFTLYFTIVDAKLSKKKVLSFLKSLLDGPSLFNKPYEQNIKLKVEKQVDKQSKHTVVSKIMLPTYCTVRLKWKIYTKTRYTIKTR